MKQILIEKNGVEHIMNIPDGSKVTIDGNIVVFEPKFKKGDVIFWDSPSGLNGIIIIENGIYTEQIPCIVHLSKAGNVWIGGSISNKNQPKLRYATDTEKQLLFDALEKHGKRWNAEKLCIEDLKVVPKVGDCVKCETTTGTTVFGKIEKIDGNVLYFYSSLRNGAIKQKGKWYLGGSIDPIVLVKQQFQTELAQLGFEYNFENDTISELKWKPKEGEYVWILASSDGKFEPYKTKFDKNSYCQNSYNENKVFKTCKLCQQAIDKIKQVLSEK